MTTETGYKMVQEDGTSYYELAPKVTYAVGSVVEQDGPRGGACGVGLHLCREPSGPLQMNARYPWRLLRCEYASEDVLGADETKVRVRKLTVVAELDPFADLGLPNAGRLKETLDRCSRIRLLAQTPARKKKIVTLVRRYAKALTGTDPEKRKVPVENVKVYTMKEWGSVRASAWDSVRASVRDSVWAVWASVWASVRASVRASVWASAHHPFSIELEILEQGAVLHGIDKDGVAHVIMPSQDEVPPESPPKKKEGVR